MIGALSIDIEAKRVTANGIAVDPLSGVGAARAVPDARKGASGTSSVKANYDDHLSINTIEVYVSRLRAKIEPAGMHIRTVRGFGYLWEQLDA